MIRNLMKFSLLSLFNILTACGQQTYDQKLNSLYSHTVDLIQPQELDSLMAKKNVLLLDTRSRSEYTVSHLPNAQFVNYDDFKVEDFQEQNKDKTIVVYCSVGYRSEKVGEALRKAGYKDVQNLYGGIFQWKNEGFIVHNQNGEPTDSVHTYNKRWGKWLNDSAGIKVTD